VLTDLVYDGGRTMYLHRDLTTIPVLAAGGAIVALDGRPVPGNEPINPGLVELLVVVGADGEFELVEDDGSATGPVTRTRMSYHQDRGELVVGPARGAGNGVPASRTWTVTFPALTAADPVALVDGAPVPAQLRREQTRTSITVDEVPAAATLRIDLGARPRLCRNDVAGRLFTLLDRAQLEYRTKTRVMDAASSAQPLAVRVSNLQVLDLDDALSTAVGEILLAQADDPPCG
jgi:hypothetical protein